MQMESRHLMCSHKEALVQSILPMYRWAAERCQTCCSCSSSCHSVDITLLEMPSGVATHLGYIRSLYCILTVQSKPGSEVLFYFTQPWNWSTDLNQQYFPWLVNDSQNMAFCFCLQQQLSFCMWCIYRVNLNQPVILFHKK